MTLINEIVKIDIKRDTLGINTVSLNTLLIIGVTNKANNIRVKEYRSLLEVAADYADTCPEYKAATLYFGQTITPTKLLIGQCLGTETYAAAYPKIALENNNFYGVLIASKIQADQLAIAALIETDTKIFGVSSKDLKTLDTGDQSHIIYKLKAGNFNRTFCIYNSGAETAYPEAAWFGLMLSKDAGTGTWAYKNLSGFIADKLTTDNRTQIANNNGNYYVSFGGVDIMLDGKTSKGEYIDIIQGLDWLTINLQTKIANALISSDKIPFTNAGIAIIESMVRNGLNEAAERNLIDRETILVSVPDVRDVSTEDRNSRTLPNVKFEARLAGAIHKIQIKGTVTV